MPAPELVLRDIHQPPAPSWWPPALGWWIVFAALVVVIVLLAAWWLRRRRRQAQVARLFDQRVAAASTPAARIAAVSELLRRAARLRDPIADRLDGEAWLRFLDRNDERKQKVPHNTSKQTHFSRGPGRILLDGAFKRSVAEDDVAALLPLARARYLQLMVGRRPSTSSEGSE